AGLRREDRPSGRPAARGAGRGHRAHRGRRVGAHGAPAARGHAPPVRRAVRAGPAGVGGARGLPGRPLHDLRLVDGGGHGPRPPRGAAPAVIAMAVSRRGVLAATILGSSLAFIDGTVVNVALPALQSALGAGLADVQWVVEAYALLFSALLLVGGALGDRYGRRRVYATGIGLFTAAPVLCGLATSVGLLVAWRAVQGLGAALLVPGSLALIAASFPEKERGRAIGTWSAFSAMTTAVGPVVGGWLIDHFSWRWAFFLNLP